MTSKLETGLIIRATLQKFTISLNHSSTELLSPPAENRSMADDIRTKHAFVWGDLNARNQPNAFSYGET